MTFDEFQDALLDLYKRTYALKEQVWMEGNQGVQKDFDAGILEAACACFRTNIDTDDQRLVDIEKRFANARLAWATKHSDETAGVKG